ncbi:MAG: UDP-N-acetylglucosamine 2-epimerase (non-hydrolyzing) [Candidatus Sumerlaeia bacterium]
MKIINVVGARPNFMKIAPIMEAYKPYPAIQPLLVHTGQHYDEKMSNLIFRDLGIPEPDMNLGVGGGSHAVNTAETMKAFEQVCLSEKPDAVLVVGDVNSTIACGLVAVKLGAKLIHVEAGLRSFDRGMPEEINRLLTDAISDYLFCSEPSGVENLKREGVADEKIFLIGNVMIDTLLKNLKKAQENRILEELGVEENRYAALTLHRPSNVDDPAVFERIVDALEVIQRDMPIIFPVHPRTRKNFEGTPLGERLRAMTNIILIEPVGYLEFLKCMASARIVLTDSGGIQEETTILHVPCLTLRENTERPVTVTEGTNQVVGMDTRVILEAYARVMRGEFQVRTPPLWDGHAAERIVKILAEKF